MFDFRLALAAAGLLGALTATAVAEDVKKDPPKAPPSQSSYTPNDKAGAASPAKPAPPAQPTDTGKAAK